MNDIMLSLLFFSITALIFTLLEFLIPLRKVDWRKKLHVDIFALFLSLSLSGFFILSASLLLSPLQSLRPQMSQWSHLEKFAIFFLFADFSKYFFHVVMHTKQGWPIHRFHHTPRELYWASGNRASVLMLFFHFFPIGVFIWYFSISAEYILLNSCLNILWNHIMHTNVKLPSRLSRFFEYFVVTPRFHHIHHINESKLFNHNFGSILTIWDRIFKTYLDPEIVNIEDYVFGDRDPAVDDLKLKLILGI